MATMRVMAIATAATNSSTTTTSLIFKRPTAQLKQCSTQSLTLSLKRTLSRRLFTCRAIYKPKEIQIKNDGQPETLNYRVFFHDNSNKKVLFLTLYLGWKIFPWHDIPLKLGDGIFNFVVEMPKEPSAQKEVATEEQFTPIKQDTKKGKLRA